MSNAAAKGRAVFFLCVAVGLCLQWIVLSHTVSLSLELRTLLPGLAIFGAAFLLAWGSEVLQFDIPRTLAFAFVALVAILPEYAVDIYFAWQGGKDPAYIPYALANMTGANRILIGVGWTGVMFAYVFASRKGSIQLEESHRVEILGIGVATLYSFLLPLKGSITLIDSCILFCLFGMYIRSAMRSHVVEPELEGGPVELLANLIPWKRRAAALILFVIAGTAILTGAAPFAEGLLEVGSHWGVDKFIMVQWVAPLASEAPEFLIAGIFALHHKPAAGLSTVISSLMNQWTLLVGAIPIAFCLSSGTWHGIPIDTRQVEELLLTSAQSLFALVVIMNLRFMWWEALLLFTLFVVQVFFPSTSVRFAFGVVYLILAVGIILSNRETQRNIGITARLFLK